MIKTFLRAMLKPLSFLPAIGMMCLIYYLSGQDGQTSAGLSLKVSIKVVEIAAKIFDHTLTTRNLTLCRFDSLFDQKICTHGSLLYVGSFCIFSTVRLRTSRNSANDRSRRILCSLCLHRRISSVFDCRTRTIKKGRYDRQYWYSCRHHHRAYRRFYRTKNNF